MNPAALHNISYGLYVLTTNESDTPYGCIVNTVFQITSQPPRLAVSCNRDNFTHDKILSSESFGVTVLSEACDPSLIGTFGYKSGRDVDKFSELTYSDGEKTGVPLLDEQGMTTFECKLIDSLQVGTHTIFIGEVLDSSVTNTSEREMTYRYYHEVLKGSAPKNAPTYQAEKATKPPTSTSEIWVCSICGYVYDSTVGEGDAPAGTRFADLPNEWVCPICGVGKEMFSRKE